MAGAGEREPLVKPPTTTVAVGDVEKGGDTVKSDASPSARSLTARAVAGVIAGVLLVACGALAAYVQYGGDGGSRLDVIKSARLGDITLDCPAGIFPPANRGPDDGKFTLLTIGLSRYADNIFIICTSKCDMNVPLEFEDKVMMLNGYELDKCNGIEWMDHWVKTSQAHLVAVSYALSKGSKMAMILEQDTATAPDAGFDAGNWQQLNDALENHDWFLLRMGYRPLTIEYDPQIEECPEACRCEDAGAQLCWLQNSGCDLRASDAYMVSESGMQHYAEALSSGGIIDNGVLQSMPNQMLITPQINYQTEATTDFTSLQHQRDVQGIFMERCKLGLTATAAREAAQATLGDEDDKDSADSASLGSSTKKSEKINPYKAASTDGFINDEEGRPVPVRSTVSGFGGLHELFESKRRLGVQVR